MRATKSRTGSPPVSPSQRSCEGRARSSAKASWARSTGVPCQSGLRISSSQSSTTSGRSRRASNGAAVWRALVIGET